MTFYDELKDGHTELQKEVGESATYNGSVTFIGVFDEIDPASQLAMAGDDVLDALTCDAASTQFSAPPVKGKRVVYQSKTYVIRDVFLVGTGAYRFRLYLP